MNLTSTFTDLIEKLPLYDGDNFKEVDVRALGQQGAFCHIIGVAYRVLGNGKFDIIVKTDRDEIISVSQFRVSVLVEIAKQV